MACGSCSSGGCSSGGCGKSGGCATGGCNKLNSFDWLNNMLPPNRAEVDNIYEIHFKNTRKAFYRNTNGLRLYIGDYVVVEGERGYDIGRLSLGGVMAQLQMRKKRVLATNPDEIPRIFRKATDDDLTLLRDLRAKEHDFLIQSREAVDELGMNMKISEVEYQADGSKAIFYYIADHRVDFRELIKMLAQRFKIRIEMRQIGLRHEAAMVGGLGVCGRELCCSTWLTDFKTVGTAAARYQNLSLNPAKISGQCGRLKCCLNFELDGYVEALQEFPKADKLQTVRGIAFLQKTDIFKGVMWYSYANDGTWYPLTTQEVKALLAEIKEGRKPESLGALAEAKAVQVAAESTEENFDFVDVVGQMAFSATNDRARNRKKPNKGGNNPNQPQRPEARSQQPKQSQAAQPQRPPQPQQPQQQRPPKQQQPQQQRPPKPQPPKQQPNIQQKPNAEQAATTDKQPQQQRSRNRPKPQRKPRNNNTPNDNTPPTA